MLDTFWMLKAKLAGHGTLVLVLKIEIALSKLLILLDHLV